MSSNLAIPKRPYVAEPCKVALLILQIENIYCFYCWPRSLKILNRDMTDIITDMKRLYFKRTHQWRQ